jgi:hypothetical protein
MCGRSGAPSLPCRRHILPLLVACSTGLSVWGNILISALSSIRIAAAFVAVAIVAAGCSAVNNATSSQASTQGEPSYKTMYGISSEGTTTDLYTELFGPRQPPPAPAAAIATTQPVQPTEPTAPQPVAPVQVAAPVQQSATTTRPARAGQPATATAANRTPQAAPPPPVQVAQQPAPAPPPPEPDVPAAYGITANGPTTDLYTMIFGPRRSDGQ